MGRPPKPKPVSPDDEYEPERPLKKSTIVEEPQVIRVEPAPAFAQATDEAALDAAPEPTLVPRTIPIPPPGPEYSADWAGDVLEREPPYVRPLSTEPNYLEQARERGLIRDDTPTPVPNWTFFSGVFSYPWRTGSIARWAVMTVAFVPWGILLLIVVSQLIGGGLSEGSIGTPFLMAGLAGATIVVGAFSSACFNWVVDITAEGNDDVDESLFPPLDQWVPSMFAAGGILFMAAALGYPLTLIPGAGPWPILVTGLVLFPILYLSAMECGSYFLPLSPVIWKTIRRYPGTWLAFYLVSTVSIALWFAATEGLLIAAPAIAVFLSAPLLAALVLIYARLLGRLAWRITMLAPPPATSSGKAPAKPPAATGKKTRRLKLNIPDDLGAAPPATDRKGQPRPRIDFHKR